MERPPQRQQKYRIADPQRGAHQRDDHTGLLADGVVVEPDGAFADTDLDGAQAAVHFFHLRRAAVDGGPPAVIVRHGKENKLLAFGGDNGGKAVIVGDKAAGGGGGTVFAVLKVSCIAHHVQTAFRKRLQQVAVLVDLFIVQHQRAQQNIGAAAFGQ